MARVITAGVDDTRPKAPAEARNTRWRAVVLTWSGAVLAGGAGWFTATTIGPTAIDPELSLLIRGMAGIKAMMVLALLAALTWRTRWPLPPPLWSAYTLGAWGMAFATVLIWHYTFIAAAAVFFHAAELLVLVLAWQDGRQRFGLFDYAGRVQGAPGLRSRSAPSSAR